MKKRNKKYLYSFFSFLLLSSLVFVSAQSNNSNAGNEPVKSLQEERRLERQEEMENKKEDRVDSRNLRACERVQNRVQNAIERYRGNTNRYRSFFNGIEVKLTNLISKASAAGYDTSKLEDDLETLRNMITEASQTLYDYLDVLESSEEFTCGESEGVYKDQIKEAKELVKQLRTEIQEMRSFYHETLKPDLNELREQRKERAMERSDQDGDENDDDDSALETEEGDESDSPDDDTDVEDENESDEGGTEDEDGEGTENSEETEELE
jgi:gas vesicle protein